MPELLSVLYTQRPAVLAVDLTDDSFLACAGVSALVCVRGAAARAGCHLRITHPQPTVRRVLVLTGMLSDVAAATTAPVATASWPGCPVPPEAAAVAAALVSLKPEARPAA